MRAGDVGRQGARRRQERGGRQGPWLLHHLRRSVPHKVHAGAAAAAAAAAERGLPGTAALTDAAIAGSVCSINSLHTMPHQPLPRILEPHPCTLHPSVATCSNLQEQGAAEGEDVGAAARQCTLCLEGLSDVEAVLGCRPPGPHQLYRSYFVKFKGKSYRWVGAELAGR